MSESLEALTRDRLLSLAAERGVRVRRGARKADILEALRAPLEPGPGDAPSSVERTAGRSAAPPPAPPAGVPSSEAQAASASDPVHGDLPPSTPAGNGQFDAGRSKFDLAGDAPAPAPHDLPWGYGRTRVTALPRDPSWLYVYWEATDEALADARARLGPGGTSAFFVLRVYDTTFRLFDGTNAQSYFDVPVDRAWNSYFLSVGRPGSTFHVDIGLKSHEGYFAMAARSGPAEMPSDRVSSDGRAEWMTVHAGQAAPRPQPYRHRHVPRPAPAHPWSPPPAGGGGEGARPGGVGEGDFERILASLVGGEAARGEWFEQIMGGRVVRWVRWEGLRRRTEWRAGPYTVPVAARSMVEVWFQGRRRIVRTLQGAERVELGPWHVLITALDARGERRILDTWRVEVAWTTGAGEVRVVTPVLYRRIFGAYRRQAVLGDGSEIWVRGEEGASEELLGGASGRLWVGASELAWGGASDMLWAGSSGLLLGGASEFAFAGASERQWPGAGELLLGGASGFAFGGASGAPFGSAQGMGGGALSGEPLDAGPRRVGIASGTGWSGYAVAPGTEEGARASVPGPSTPAAAVGQSATASGSVRSGVKEPPRGGGPGAPARPGPGDPSPARVIRSAPAGRPVRTARPRRSAPSGVQPKSSATPVMPDAAVPSAAPRRSKRRA